MTPTTSHSRSLAALPLHGAVIDVTEASPGRPRIELPMIALRQALVRCQAEARSDVLPYGFGDALLGVVGQYAAAPDVTLEQRCAAIKSHELLPDVLGKGIQNLLMSMPTEEIIQRCRESAAENGLAEDLQPLLDDLSRTAATLHECVASLPAAHARPATISDDAWAMARIRHMSFIFEAMDRCILLGHEVKTKVLSVFGADSRAGVRLSADLARSLIGYHALHPPGELLHGATEHIPPELRDFSSARQIQNAAGHRVPLDDEQIEAFRQAVSLHWDPDHHVFDIEALEKSMCQEQGTFTAAQLFDQLGDAEVWRGLDDGFMREGEGIRAVRLSADCGQEVFVGLLSAIQQARLPALHIQMVCHRPLDDAHMEALQTVAGSYGVQLDFVKGQSHDDSPRPADPAALMPVRPQRDCIVS